MNATYKLPPTLMAGVAIAGGGNGYDGDTLLAQGCIALAIIAATVLFIMINMSK